MPMVAMPVCHYAFIFGWVQCAHCGVRVCLFSWPWDNALAVGANNPVHLSIGLNHEIIPFENEMTAGVTGPYYNITIDDELSNSLLGVKMILNFPRQIKFHCWCNSDITDLRCEMATPFFACCQLIWLIGVSLGSPRSKTNDPIICAISSEASSSVCSLILSIIAGRT